MEHVVIATYLIGLIAFAMSSEAWRTSPDTDRYPPVWMQMALNILCLVFWPITVAYGLMRRP